MPHALLLEDDAASLDALERIVQRHGFTTSPVQTLASARKEVDANMPEFAVLDLDVPDGNGLELLEELHAGLQAEVIVVTGHGSIETAVDALRSGAADYLTKPIDTERLDGILESVKRTLELRKEVTRLRTELRRLGRFDQLVGSSPPMQEMYDLISRVAGTDSTVLLTGETGTGKDLVARTIHRLSARRDEPFLAVNCGAIQASLIESELFGHEPGSFTGASRTRKGVFELAAGGTLFLDEITEMPADLQVKLLRVLETRSLRRVGGEKSIDVDVRLLAATNRRPKDAVRDGKLREDLYYRLGVFPIDVPALRERGDDVQLLATFFLNKLEQETGESRRLDPKALDRLRSHDWPGNVRELRNAVERAFILSAQSIEPEHVSLDAGALPRSTSGEGVLVEVGSTIAQGERQLILATLDHLDGDKRKAAEMLGISLKTLYNRLNSYGLGRSKTGS